MNSQIFFSFFTVYVLLVNKKTRTLPTTQSDQITDGVRTILSSFFLPSLLLHLILISAVFRRLLLLLYCSMMDKKQTTTISQRKERVQTRIVSLSSLLPLQNIRDRSFHSLDKAYPHLRSIHSLSSSNSICSFLRSPRAHV